MKSVKIIISILLVMTITCGVAFAYNPKGKQEYLFAYNDNGRPFPYTVYPTEKDARFETNAIHLDEGKYAWKQYYIEDLDKQSFYGKELYKMTIETEEVFYIPESPVYLIGLRTLEEGIEFADIVSNNMHIMPGSELYVTGGQFGNRDVLFQLNNGYIISKYQFDGIRDILNYWRIYEEQDYLMDYYFGVNLVSFREDDGTIQLMVDSDLFEGSQPIVIMCNLNPDRTFNLFGGCYLTTEKTKINLKDVVLVSEKGSLSLAKYGEFGEVPAILDSNPSEFISFDLTPSIDFLLKVEDFLASESPKIRFIGSKKTVEVIPNTEWLTLNLHLINFTFNLLTVVDEQSNGK